MCAVCTGTWPPPAALTNPDGTSLHKHGAGPVGGASQCRPEPASASARAGQCQDRGSFRPGAGQGQARGTAGQGRGGGRSAALRSAPQLGGLGCFSKGRVGGGVVGRRPGDGGVD